MRGGVEIRRPTLNFSFISALALLAAALLFPAFCADALKDALSLCADTLVPALLLYITAANLLSSCGVFSGFSKTVAGRLFRRVSGLSDAGAAAFVVGIASGFPAGAVFLAKTKRSGGVTDIEAARLLPFANNASPAFVMGVTGSLFRSPAFGVLLFSSQLFASFTGVLLERAIFGNAPQAAGFCDREDFISAFPRAVRESVAAMLAICGFVAVFSVPCRAFAGLGSFGAFLSAVCEIGNGCAAAGNAGSYAAAGVATGFSGLSVMFQIADIAGREGISMKYYLPGKIYSCIICLLSVNIFAFFDLF